MALLATTSAGLSVGWAVILTSGMLPPTIIAILILFDALFHFLASVVSFQ